jgi:hypothetical protein
LEFRVYGAGLVNEKLEPCYLEDFKPFVRDLEIVLPDWDVGDAVNSSLPGEGRHFETCGG